MAMEFKSLVLEIYVFSLGSIAYVGFDIYLEHMRAKTVLKYF